MAKDLPQQGLHFMIKDAIRSKSMSLQAVSRRNHVKQSVGGNVKQSAGGIMIIKTRFIRS